MTIKRVYTGRNITMFYKGSMRDFAEIAMSPRILAICLEVATEEALPYAIAISPVGESGTYIRSWRVRPTTTVVAGMRRVGAKLINEDPISALVEFGGRKGGGSCDTHENRAPRGARAGGPARGTATADGGTEGRQRPGGARPRTRRCARAEPGAPSASAGG